MQVSDFKRSGHLKPSGPCIWMDCGEPATMVVTCTKRPILMDACDVHGKIFIEDSALTPGGEGISVEVILDDVRMED